MFIVRAARPADEGRGIVREGRMDGGWMSESSPVLVLGGLAWKQ